MDIDRVIQNLREAKKKASCPPGFRYSKKMNMCVPTRKSKGKYKGIRGYYIGGGYYRGGDNRSDSGKEMVTETVMVMVMVETVEEMVAG